MFWYEMLFDRHRTENRHSFRVVIHVKFIAKNTCTIIKQISGDASDNVIFQWLLFNRYCMV